MKKKTVYIIAHTHWDREWYLSFQQFRFRLIDVINTVCDLLESAEGFNHFVLDGQAAILEDYLELYPENASRIKTLVEKGKLSIGPWYILPDEFLVSPESTIRNLLMGEQVCHRFGGAQKVGYMPDSFGHIAQMPQILNKSGINSFIYMRGNGNELESLGSEFIWKGPDGSTVLAIHQVGGYCNGASLGFDALWEGKTERKPDTAILRQQVGKLLKRLEKYSNTDTLVINNGCDHMPPQPQLPVLIKELNKVLPGYRFKIGDWSGFIEDVLHRQEALTGYSGELLKGRYHYILSGVWSTRMYLKQANHRAQNLLEKYIEPLAVYAWICHGLPYPSRILDHCWKRLLQNHPHDSICGCSLDEVHQEMEVRFNDVIHNAQEAQNRVMEYLNPSLCRNLEGIEDIMLTVFNPLAYTRNQVTERLVYLPANTDLSQIGVIDDQGKPAMFYLRSGWFMQPHAGGDNLPVLHFTERYHFLMDFQSHFPQRVSIKGSTGAGSVQMALIQIYVENINAVSHRNYYLTTTGPALTNRNNLVVDGHTLENRFCRVTVYPNGTFDLLDKRSGQIFQGLNRLEDSSDTGDTYDYSSLSGDTGIYTDDQAGEIEIVSEGPLSGQLKVKFNFYLPESLAQDRNSRSKSLIPCVTEILIGLCYDSARVEIKTKFENRAKDHRLRTHFPLKISSKFLTSDGNFYTNHRSLEKIDANGWAQPPSGTFPQRDYSLISDGKNGLAIFNKGLPEIAATANAEGGVTAALTLLRAVGWLSRDDLSTREENAGPVLPTPEAQCWGSHVFEYAIYPFSGNEIAAGVKRESELFQVPVLVHQGLKDTSVTEPDRLIDSVSNHVAVTAIKKHVQRDTLIIRLYNLLDRVHEEELKFYKEIRQVWNVNLIEERLSPKEFKENIVKLELNPHEIATLELEFK
ncbi:MAG: hypothetical protein E4H13_09480 [Calditrichales bacterium]|nr:MAG: hypothetical protein E4H13_09480 [Calditrichales bacterium]